jgi:glycosidase
MRAVAKGLNNNTAVFRGLQQDIDFSRLNGVRSINSNNNIDLLEAHRHRAIDEQSATHVDMGLNRAINRHQWDLEQLEQMLQDSNSQHHQVFTRLRELIRLRCAQPAFHPNATQFTLQVGRQLFGFWRQSLDRSQSIFCITNISDQPQRLALADINLIATDQWHDLIGGTRFHALDQEVTLDPYQVLWISNT